MYTKVIQLRLQKSKSVYMQRTDCLRKTQTTYVSTTQRKPFTQVKITKSNARIQEKYHQTPMLEYGESPLRKNAD